MTGRPASPPAPRRQQGPDRIEDPSRVRRPGAAHPALGRDQRGNQGPFRIRQIVLPIVMRPAILRPVASLHAMVSSFVGGQTPGRITQPEAAPDFRNRHLESISRRRRFLVSQAN